MRSCFVFSLNPSFIGRSSVLALALLAPLAALGQVGIILPVAGTGDNGYTGNGGPALDAKLDAPMGVALDQQGNLYIADYFNNVVRKVTPAGVISNFAGNGFGAAGSGCIVGCFGYSGDGGPATSAELSFPSDVVADHFGNVYISDTINNVIRKVDAAGIITTVAGNGFAAGGGYGNYGGDGGPATEAELSFPTGIAVDAIGNLYIADSANYVIRKVNSAGTISTVAGNVTIICSYPNCVYPIPNNGDGGPATSAALGFPRGVAVAPDGSLYIADTEDNVIRRVNAAGIISTVVGGGSHRERGYVGPAKNVSLINPYRVTFDGDGNLYVADSGGEQVRKVNAAGTISSLVGGGPISPEGNSSAETSLAAPVGIALSSQGDLYIADPDENMVYRVTYPHAGVAPILRPKR